MSNTAYKALTLPIHDFDSDKRSKYVTEATTDFLLLFLCETEILEKDSSILAGTTDQVLVYLHVLSTGLNDMFSVPYRVLKFNRSTFFDGIVSNNCVLPKRLFFVGLVKDLIPDELTIRIKNKPQFKKTFIQRYNDFNSFFQNQYRNMKYEPFKMFIMTYYFFKYGMKRSLYVVSDIYDKYFDYRETTNPKENYHLLNYMIRRYEHISLADMDKCISEFDRLIEAFHRKSLTTYSELNCITKSYTHEETGGVICSFALTKSFQSFSAIDFVDETKTNKYEEMITTFSNEVTYHNKLKYDEIDVLVARNVHVYERTTNSLTRYLLKKQADPLFEMKEKKVELKSILTKRLLKYYGTFPAPHIEFRPLTLLCEMMAGVYNESNKFASSEIMMLKPFKPILTRWEGKEYRIMSLNALNIDKPIPVGVITAIEKHLKNPCLHSYVNYCWKLVDHIKTCGYFYHEVINPFLPMYTINADIDIYDKQYIKFYYQNENHWDTKRILFENLKQLVLYVCCHVMKLSVSEDDTYFFMYESWRDDLDKIETPKFKLGVRLIVKFSNVCFMNRTVVDALLKVMNVYRYKFEHLRQIQDENIFDSAILEQACHEIRLPMNLKPDGSKALLPVFFECHSKTFLKALFMTSALVHYMNCASNEITKIQYVSNVSLPTEEIISKFDTDSVYRNMYIAKSEQIVSNKDTKYDILKTFKFTDRQKEELIEALNRFSLGRLKHRSNLRIRKIFLSKPLVYKNKGIFTWCSGLKFCAITAHVKASGNPCDYYVRLNPKVNERFNKRECYIYCHCFSSRCQGSTRNNCILKCLI